MSALQVSCEGHRLQKVSRAEFVVFKRPFSCFSFVAERFGGAATVHRCFSLARSAECEGCVVESLDDIGLLAEDTKELTQMGYRCRPENIRISFWKKPVRKKEDVASLTDQDLFGYAIVRCDGYNSDDPKWYVFEAVLRKYNHKHNCVAYPGEYSLSVCGKAFRMVGVMYCQQNELNKRCAQVSLRALLSRVVPGHDVSYAKINGIVSRFCKGKNEKFDPAEGMKVEQIQAVLKAFGIRFKDVDYQCSGRRKAKLKRDLPYSKFLYAGVESGLGALLGFKVHDKKEDSRHIIPMFGHTFNKDSWVSDARKFYFNDKDANSAYMPSDSWTSSFIGHDDNLGANFCVPRAYVLPDDVDYIVELYRPGVVYSGAIAEAIAFQVLKHLEEQLQTENEWTPRFLDALDEGKVILRSVSIEKERYLEHLREMEDWKGCKESRDTVNGFAQMKLPTVLWAVEISLPQLFPATERKIGEIVLDATVPVGTNDFQHGRVSRNFLKSILFVRLPGWYYFKPLKSCVRKGEDGKTIVFDSAPSSLVSHVGVL